jgi:phenylalanyl-tRNA synthetase beta chain
MIIPYELLKEILKDSTPPIDELIKKLINIGFEVEDLTNPVNKNVITVRVENIEKIESFNDLLKVGINDNERTITVVTSWNKLKVGGIYTYAPPQTEILGKIVEVRKFGDITSEGMLLSYKELEMNPDFLSAEEREGIMELPADTPVGKNFYKLFLSTQINLKVPFNRADCYSFLGILREILTAFEISSPPDIKSNISYIYPTFNVTKIKRDKAKEDFQGIKIISKDACPFYSCIIVDKIKPDKSPYLLRKLLISFGIRPISNIVDIANLVMYFYGQPLHTFDYDAISGKEIIVRQGKIGEEMNAIDGKTYPLNEEDLVIADNLHPMAIAGIIGGASTEINNSSKAVLIESAYFDPLYISRTSSRLNINTDASARFSRGVDRTRTKELAIMAANLIAFVCNGTIAGEIYQDGTDKFEPKRISFSIPEFKKVTGIDLDRYTATRILSRLEIPFEIKSLDQLIVKVPSFRETDIKEDVDVIEEILRFVGYDKITPKASLSYIKYEYENANFQLKEKLRNTLAGLGFYEIVTDTFVEDDLIFSVYGDNIGDFVRVKNPIKTGWSFLSPNRVFQFCDVAAKNLFRKKTDLKLFEIGKHYLQDAEDEFLDIALTGNRNIESWLEKPEKVDFFYGKGIIESLFKRYKLPFKERRSIEGRILDPIESVEFYMDNVKIGSFGKVEKKIIDFFGINEEIFYGSIKLSSLLMKYILQTPKYNPTPKTQEVIRDIALVVDEVVKVGDVITKIKALASSSLTNITFFDVYRGKNIPENKKSIALRLTFNFGINLKGEQIQNTLEKIINEVCLTFNAILRR